MQPGPALDGTGECLNVFGAGLKTKNRAITGTVCEFLRGFERDAGDYHHYLKRYHSGLTIAIGMIQLLSGVGDRALDLDNSGGEIAESIPALRQRTFGWGNSVWSHQAGHRLVRGTPCDDYGALRCLIRYPFGTNYPFNGQSLPQPVGRVGLHGHVKGALHEGHDMRYNRIRPAGIDRLLHAGC